MRTYQNVFELTTRYDSRRSFYGKAQVLEDTDGNYWLKSYETIVAYCDRETGEVVTMGYYSTTTSRHQKEFVSQFDRTGRTWEQVKRESVEKSENLTA